MKLATPHDSFFKYVMSRIEAVHDFIINYLPPHVAKQFDLSSLAIRKDSFIDEKLAEHFSDMLYEINLLDERAGELYLLFEHKSFPKRQTIFDLLRYMVNIWQQQALQRPKGQILELKPIIPIIIYHSSSEWASPKSFIKLFSEHLPEELKPFVPDFQIVLCDLSQLSDSDIKGEVLLQIAFLFWKHFYVIRTQKTAAGHLGLAYLRAR